MRAQPTWISARPSNSQRLLLADADPLRFWDMIAATVHQKLNHIWTILDAHILHLSICNNALRIIASGPHFV